MFRWRKSRQPKYELTPVIFREAREVTSAQLMELYHFLKTCESAGELSVGAYVVRNANDKDLDEFKANAFRSSYKSDYYLGRDTSLHTHVGSMLLAETITINETLKGIVETAVLDWSEAPTIADSRHQGYVHHYATSDAQTVAALHAELFDDSLVRTTPNHSDIHGVRAVLNPGDIIIFDHTLPHAFRSLTADRASEAHFGL